MYKANIKKANIELPVLYKDVHLNIDGGIFYINNELIADIH